MKKLFLKLQFSLFIFVILFLCVFIQKTNAQVGAPNTEGTIRACLGAGGDVEQCVREGETYLQKCGLACSSDGVTPIQTTVTCDNVQCTLTCNNGANLSFPKPSPPPDKPADKVCPDGKKPGDRCDNNGIDRTCDTVNCGKAFLSKYDDNCQCVRSDEVVDDASCFTKIPACTTPPVTTTTTTPPVTTITTTTTPPVTTITTTTTPPVTTVTNPPVTNPPVTNPPVTSPPPPPFNEAMCKCENIEFTPITLGQKTTITAYGKVEGTDTQFAKIPSFNFIFYEGTDASAKPVQRQTVAATQIENTTTKARYKSVWELQIPSTLDSKKVYRIQAKPACVRKTAELPLIMQQTAILGATDDNVSFVGSIIRFFANLFGASKKEESSNLSVQSTENVPSQQPNLQIGSFKPLIATKQTDATNCSFIRLQFAQ